MESSSSPEPSATTGPGAPERRPAGRAGTTPAGNSRGTVRTLNTVGQDHGARPRQDPRHGDRQQPGWRQGARPHRERSLLLVGGVRPGRTVTLGTGGQNPAIRPGPVRLGSPPRCQGFSRQSRPRRPVALLEETPDLLPGSRDTQGQSLPQEPGPGHPELPGQLVDALELAPGQPQLDRPVEGLEVRIADRHGKAHRGGWCGSGSPTRDGSPSSSVHSRPYASATASSKSSGAIFRDMA